jgi:hypothetical protein
MRDRPTVSERLRAFVRDRVKPNGAHYERGTAARLARFLRARGFGEDAAWVSTYGDPDARPRRNADLDVALAICDFFSVQLSDFQRDVDIRVQPTTPPLTKHQARMLRVMARMNEEGQRLAVGNVAQFAPAFPKPPSQESAARSERRPAATRHTARETRRAAAAMAPTPRKLR